MGVRSDGDLEVDSHERSRKPVGQDLWMLQPLGVVREGANCHDVGGFMHLCHSLGASLWSLLMRRATHELGCVPD
jgi:hypothetical protein